MTHHLKMFTVSLAVAVAALLGGLTIASSSVYADDIKDNLCGGADLSLSSGNCKACIEHEDPNDKTSRCTKREDTAEKSVNGIIKTVINILTTIVGVVAVIFIIVAGFKYVTSGGDSGKVSSAKSTIVYAIIGLIIVALAQVIVRFVLNKV